MPARKPASHFGLHVLRRDIANQPVNYTRFVVVAATPVECDPRIAAKVSMVLSTRHEHGALVRCLNVIADEGLNLTKLESRPRPGSPWEYVFYVDVEGHIASPRMQAALAGLAERTLFREGAGVLPRPGAPIALKPSAGGVRTIIDRYGTNVCHHQARCGQEGRDRPDPGPNRGGRVHGPRACG